MSIRDELHLVLIRIPTQSTTHFTSLMVDRDGRKVERGHQQAVSAPSGCWLLDAAIWAYSDPKISFGFNSFIWVITWRSQGSFFVHQLQQEMLKCDSLDFLTFTTAGRYHDSYASGRLPQPHNCQKQEGTGAHRTAHLGLGFRHALGLTHP